jgi:integrase
VLTQPEVGELVRWLPNFSRDMADAIALYLWTCCRGAEIMAMERSEITEEPSGLWWTIPIAKLKMRRNPLTVELRVPLIGRAEVIVRRRLTSHDNRWIFKSTGRSGHIEQKAVGVAVWVHLPGCTSQSEFVRPRVPVPSWAPHDLRRTGRTVLASLGCSTDIAEAILGHLPPGIQGTYNLHDYDDERRQWLTLLAARYETLTSQVQAPGQISAATR